MAARIERLDVPLHRLEADVRALVVRQRQQAAAEQDRAAADFRASMAAGFTESFADYCRRTDAANTPAGSTS
jgi:hypothetical protein